jgi:hypothetical protein
MRCDYRNNECVNDGVIISGVWFCNNHIPTNNNPPQPTLGGDGRYCTHHDDDPAHTKECYEPEFASRPIDVAGVPE